MYVCKSIIMMEQCISFIYNINSVKITENKASKEIVNNNNSSSYSKGRNISKAKRSKAQIIMKKEKLFTDLNNQPVQPNNINTKGDNALNTLCMCGGGGREKKNEKSFLAGFHTLYTHNSNVPSI